MAAAPLLRLAQWYWPGRSPLPDACWVVATTDNAQAAHGLLSALQEAQAGPLALLLLDEGGYEGPWPWVRLPALGAARILARLKPRCLLCLDDEPQARALAAAASCPVIWVNARSAELLSLGAVAVASETLASRIGGGVVTGDPCVEWPALPPSDPGEPGFCERFRPMREADRPILYFVDTEEGEEALAYSTFLGLPAGHGGLLALAPRDAARHEGVYREAMKYHLLTVRHARLMTSELPPKTRVYYIESAPARRAMQACADLVVAGGTWAAGGAGSAEVLYRGGAILVGPYRSDPRLAAAARAGVVIPCEEVADVGRLCAAWLADGPGRAAMAQALSRWLVLQVDARARFISWFADASRRLS